MTPALALHADWSKDPGKRWMTCARPRSNGWNVEAAVPVGPLDTWLARLRADAAGGAVAVGVDLPLGLPRAYAERYADGDGFVGFLRNLNSVMASEAWQPQSHRTERAAPGLLRCAQNGAVGMPGWQDFFSVCPTLEDISPSRPFYPALGIKGMTRAGHAQALGFADASSLSRLCDRATAQRPAGAPLFWTLGANQTGKAAITAWRDVLLPAFAEPEPPRLWPFEGGLHSLLTPGAVVLAETYPAEAMRQRGIHLPGSKRRQTDRAGVAQALLTALQARNATPSPALVAEIHDGFGGDSAGEDRFDSLLGLLGLLAVLDGSQPDFIPDDPWIRRWEGWVLGQTALPVQP